MTIDLGDSMTIAVGSGALLLITLLLALPSDSPSHGNSA